MVTEEHGWPSMRHLHVATRLKDAERNVRRTLAPAVIIEPLRLDPLGEYSALDTEWLLGKFLVVV